MTPARLRLPAAPALALSLAVFVPALAGQSAPDWARFRGPNGGGVAESSSLPDRFGPEENLVWMTELPPGHSSPILWADQIFITAVRGEELLTLCLDAADGSVRWRAQSPRDRVTRMDGRNSHAAASPAVDGDTVVVFFNDYGLVAYDHHGEERWRQPLGPFNNIYGMGASPVLVGETVILPCDMQTDSFILALDKTSGEELWRQERPFARSGHCTPIVYRPEGGPTQLIVPGSLYLDSYDLRNGERLWWVGGLSFEMKSVPILHEGTLFTNGYGSPLNDPGNQIAIPTFAEAVANHDGDQDGTIDREEMPPSRAVGFFEFVDLEGDGELDAEDWKFLEDALASRNGLLAIRPAEGATGDLTESAVQWSYHRSIPQLPSPVIVDDLLYMLGDRGGIVALIDPATGAVRAKKRLRDGIDDYYASPVAGDGKVYFLSTSGILTVVAAGLDFEQLHVLELDEPCYATPALADGRIYVRSDRGLYCFGR